MGRAFYGQDLDSIAPSIVPTNMRLGARGRKKHYSDHDSHKQYDVKLYYLKVETFLLFWSMQ